MAPRSHRERLFWQTVFYFLNSIRKVKNKIHIFERGRLHVLFQEGLWEGQDPIEMTRRHVLTSLNLGQVYRDREKQPNDSNIPMLDTGKTENVIRTAGLLTRWRGASEASSRKKEQKVRGQWLTSWQIAVETANRPMDPHAMSPHCWSLGTPVLCLRQLRKARRPRTGEGEHLCTSAGSKSKWIWLTKD